MSIEAAAAGAGDATRCTSAGVDGGSIVAPEASPRDEGERRSEIVGATMRPAIGGVVGRARMNSARAPELPAGSMWGYWRVIERDDGARGTSYMCLCTMCGKTRKRVHRAHLVGGTSTKCIACARPGKMLAGREFPRWRVLAYLGTRNSHHRYRCACMVCGAEDVRVADLLLRGEDAPCGDCKRSHRAAVVTRARWAAEKGNSREVRLALVALLGVVR